MAKTPKLHELLAAESTVSGNYSRDLNETIGVLDQHTNFISTISKKNHFDENDRRLDASDVKEMTTTVPERLSWFAQHAAALYDVQYQKDLSNAAAKADIEVDGKVIAKNVPATTLLMLESKLQDFKNVLVKAPTLNPQRRWEEDQNRKHVWRASDDEKTFFTKKTTKPVVLYEATDKHPAQVKEVTEDVAIGSITRSTFSGMITSARKSDLLANLDRLMVAIKQARQRANTADAATDKIGADIVNFILSEK